MQQTLPQFIPNCYQAEPSLLAGKVILITGASRGIGSAVAKAYAAHGATTILLARTITNLEALANDILDNNHPQPAIYPFNLATATADDYQDLRRTIDQQFGQLDGIVHNAGMLGTFTPLDQYPIETWYQVMQVNLNSVFMLTQALIPMLKRSTDAAVIFTGKTPADKAVNSDQFTTAYWGAYAVANAGVNSLMQILTAEYDNVANMRFNQIIPPPTKTKLKTEAYPALNPALLQAPDDIVGAYLYLMGADSKGLKGCTVAIASNL